MTKALLSYVLLAIGLMMLMASDKHANADSNDIETRVVSFGDSKDIQVFVNKEGDSEALVELVINGEKHKFALPELVDGETQSITTSDGSEILLKAIKGERIVMLGSDEIALPSLNLSENIGSETLASVISRVHEVPDFAKETITISGQDLSDDAVKAMVDAVEGVLVSYGIEKEVMFRAAPKFEFITTQEGTVDFRGGQIKVLPNGKFDIDVDVQGTGSENVFVIEKHIEVEEKQ